MVLVTKRFQIICIFLVTLTVLLVFVTERKLRKSTYHSNGGPNKQNVISELKVENLLSAKTSRGQELSKSSQNDDDDDASVALALKVRVQAFSLK